jgi:primase-polymerase (primpol)-like protein
MRDLDRWVRHSVKVPKTPDGRPASVSDPATWSSWREASASKVGEGLGFVLGDGIGGLDLDRVLSRGGVLLPAARRLLDALPRTYVEVSPSRTGLHVLGLMPPGRGRVVDFEGVKVEVYPSGRYLTVTGDRFGGAPPRLADLGAQVAMLLAG